MRRNSSGSRPAGVEPGPPRRVRPARRCRRGSHAVAYSPRPGLRWPCRDRSVIPRTRSASSTTASSASTTRWRTTSRSSNSRPRLVRASQDGVRRRRRGADPVPDARAPRHAVRAQLLPLPRPLPDLRGARVVPAPHRLASTSSRALRQGDRRLLRPGGRRRAHAGRKAGRLLFEPVDAGARRAARARSSRRSTSTHSRPTSGSSRQGVARELARTVLPLGAYTEFYWTLNAARADALRVAAELASSRNSRSGATRRRSRSSSRERMPVTHAAFVANGRVAP